MYYLLVTVAGLIIAGCSLGFTSKQDNHTKIVVAGFAGIFAGSVFFVYGRFYTASPDNLFAITDRDLMFAGVTNVVIGIIFAWGVSSFIAARTKRPARQAQVRVNQIDPAYWPQPF